MLVDVHVSSMKTRRSGSRSSWPSNQSSRRFRYPRDPARSHGRTFFERQPAAVEERPQRRPAGPQAPIHQKPFQQLADRQVWRFRDQPKQIVTVRIEFRAARLALLARPAFAVRERPAHPDNRRCLANTEPRRGLPRRAPGQRRVNHPISQILAVGSRHALPPSLSRHRTRSVRALWESQTESEIGEHALGHRLINRIQILVAANLTRAR